MRIGVMLWGLSLATPALAASTVTDNAPWTSMVAVATVAAGLAAVLAGSVRSRKPRNERWRTTPLPERERHQDLSPTAHGPLDSRTPPRLSRRLADLGRDHRDATL